MSVRYAAKCGNKEGAAKWGGWKALKKHFPATVLHGHRRVSEGMDVIVRRDAN